MNKSILMGGGVLLLVATLVLAQGELPSEPGAPPAGQPTAPPTMAQLCSYAIGLEIGSSFSADEIQLDPQSVAAGLRDGISGAKPRYSKQQLTAAMRRLARERIRSMAPEQIAYLEKNETAEGVQVTETGLQYKVLKTGSGSTPQATDRVRCHYRGQLIDGTVFDSSYERNEPAVFPVQGVIPGWTEALQKMKVGDKWQLVLPSDLAYGEAGAGQAIPGNATLVFEVELLGIE